MRIVNMEIRLLENKSTMILWCLEENRSAIEFYKKMGGEIKEHKLAPIGEQSYPEVGIVYDVKKLYKKSNN